MRFIASLLLLFVRGICAAQGPSEDLIELPPGIQASDSQNSEVKLTRYKKQALQSVSISSGWLGDVSGDSLSGSFLDASIGGGIPLGSLDNIIGVTPRMRIDWIQVRAEIDIPSELYLFETQFFYRRPINQRLSAMAIFSPSVRSDLSTSEDAFRVFALGLLNWEYMPDRLTVSGGAVYLGRADLPVLPALGLTWTPNPTTKLDLRFPSSRLAYRLNKDGGRSEKWSYLSLGLGGDTWAVTRQSGSADLLSLRDIRLTFGLEKLLDGGGGWFLESGYGFNRRLEYDSQEAQVQLGEAVFFQAGWRY